jgi:hypothetical protein
MLVIPTRVTLTHLVALLAILVAALLPSGRTASAEWGPPFITVVESGPPLSAPGLRLQWTVPEEGLDAMMDLTRTPSFAEPWDPWPETSAPGWHLDEEVTPGQQYQYELCIVYMQEGVISQRFCSNKVAVTFGAAPAQGTPAVPPIISGATAYQTDVDVRWYTQPKYDYDREIIRYRVKPSAANQNPPYGEVNHDGGDEGSTRVSGLTPHTTYVFSVAGCYDLVFGIGGEECTAWGTEYEVTTLPLQSIGHGDAIVIKRHDAGENSIDLYWDKPADFGFRSYKISYREKAGGPTATETGPGDFPNFTVDNLKANTSYLFKVQGCNFDLANPALVCDDFGPEYEASTKTNAPPVGTFITAQIALSQPTITAGNAVEVTGTGWQEPIGTAVQLTLGTVQIGSATVDRGAISATVTIPADTQPGDYKIIARSANRNAEASLKVLAPSRTGTLTVTWAPSGAVDTNIEENAGPYALSGANFAPGPLTIFLDSPTGPRIESATVAANGTFRREFTLQKSVLGGTYGPRKLVVVQNGAVTGEIAVTVQREYVIR